MQVHLIDGTYELFRAYYGAPPRRAADGRPVGAVVGLLRSLLSLLRDPQTTHLAVAFDTVIESFRNDLFEGYKTGDGIDPDLWSQFPLAEQGVAALGVVVWRMIEFEADDALATAAARFAAEERVERILIASPDKDLAQCVSADRIVGWDRRRDLVIDEPGVIEKYGVPPASIPDWLALVGDSADGYPGLSGWGAKSASVVLRRFGHLEAIPAEIDGWGLAPGRARRLEATLRQHWDEAVLYRTLATLRRDVPLTESVDDLRWQGARPELRSLCLAWGDDALPDRVPKWVQGAD